MENKTEKTSQEQGYGFGKSIAMVLGVTSVIIGLVVALKILIG